MSESKEHSLFLPDGWGWKQNRQGEWFVYNTEDGEAVYPEDMREWSVFIGLHPSEGGGFQRYVPGDPMPCDGGLLIDVPWLDDITTYKANEYYWSRHIKYATVTAWRPHFPQEQ
jgi:hypothetical protein